MEGKTPEREMIHLKPGCVVSCGDHRWKIHGIHIGGMGQESLIHMESLTHEPGWTGEWEYHPMLFVPEIILRGMPISVTQPEELTS